MSAQSAELLALLVKAVRSLSEEEQDQVLRHLLSARIEPAPPPVPVPARSSVGLSASAFPPLSWVGMFGMERPNVDLLRESLTAEGGGPWQTVPVRLPVELHERLKQWCHANNFTMAVVLRGLVSRFLDEYAMPRADGTEETEPG